LFIAQYLDEHYDQIRKEAFDDLYRQFSNVSVEMKNSRQMLPILDENFIDDEVQELFLKHYPDKQTLIFACHARYILYGLHPDTIRDRKLMESLASSAIANVLL